MTIPRDYDKMQANKGVIGTLHPGCNKTANTSANSGFILNDEMDDFSVKPGAPNLYGAVGGKINAIEPGKRMLSSMTPTLVLKNKNVFSVIGTPGGTTIPTSVVQTIVNLIDFKMSVKDAVFAPKFHHQWQPDSVLVEKDFNKKTMEILSKKGYVFIHLSF